jgi:hypothetical protein
MSDEERHLPEVQTARELAPAMTEAELRKKRREELQEAAYDQFGGLAKKAISTVEELCEMADSESVRLDAAKTILKMAGIDPGTKREVNVSVDDKRAVRQEMEAVLEQLAKNNPQAAALLTGQEVVDAEVVSET